MRSLVKRVPLIAALIALAGSGCSSDTEIREVVPDCGPSHPTGTCESGQSCLEGECVATEEICSATNFEGMCGAGLTCFAGGCVVPSELCGADNPTGPCEIGDSCLEGECVATAELCSESAPEGLCPSGQTCLEGICAGDSVSCDSPIYDEQPTIAARNRDVLDIDGLQFKDSNGNGELDVYEDWRLPELCRAQDLVAQMDIDQKIGVMAESSYVGTGTTDATVPESVQTAIVDNHKRFALIRVGSVAAPDLAKYLNAVQELAESQPLGIPVTITADPLHGFGMSTDAASGAQTLSASTVVSPFPYPLGLGAINDPEVTRAFADIVREEFVAMGFRWQLGPMADQATEPRWARVQNTYGVNPTLVAYHTYETIAGFQGSENGDLRNGIAATVKHFPGAGPNEDGMDSHSYPGRYNVFPGGNFEHHQIPFQAAFDVGAAAVMPCYSIFKDQTDFDGNQVAAAYSYDLITNYLKRDMGFNGLVTADWGTLSQGYANEVLSLPQRAAMFLQAGSHQLGADDPGPLRKQSKRATLKKPSSTTPWPKSLRWRSS